ncbi:MAG: SBBP repeat-containing protein [Promethearchaeota archaeon]
MSEIQRYKLLILIFFLFLIGFCTQLNGITVSEKLSSDKSPENKYSIINPKTEAILKFTKTWALHSQDYKDLGRGICTDSKGNIYIIGDSINFSSGKGTTSALIKYDWFGNYIWNKTFHGIFHDIVIDSSDDIYIAGELIYTDMINIIKFNESGHVKWNKTWGDSTWPSKGYGIVMGLDGYIYVTGLNLTSTSVDIILLKYNKTNGNFEDSRIFIADRSIGLSTQGRDIAVDSFNNIYIVGINESNGREDILLLKYDNNLNFKWCKIWNNISGNSDIEMGFSIAIDSKDNIYVTGSISKSGVSAADILLLKFNIDGNLSWYRSWDNCGSYDTGSGIAVDYQDYIYIAGIETNASGIFNSILLKCDSNGNQIWNKSWGGNEDDQALGLTVSNSTEIIITGKTFSFAKGYKPDIFMVKYYEIPDPIIPEEPPGGFKLDSNAGDPDTDGTFNLTWSKSIGADNYSVYSHDAYIHQIKNNGTLEDQGIEELNYTISGLVSGDYYYIVIAFNETGNTSSNCLKVSIRIPPRAFNLFTDADDPDTDGNFNLTWSKSIGADNYSIYRSNNLISNLDNCIEIKSNIINLNYTVSGISSGTHYFIIVAYNRTGFTLSDYVQVNVSIAPNGLPPTQDGNDDDDDDESAIPFGNYYLIFGFITIISLIVILKRKTIFKE